MYNAEMMTCTIQHGFSVRDDGDMRKPDSISRFLTQAGLDSNNLITAQQVHGTKVQLVTEDARGSQIPDADALVYHFNDSNTPLVLGVRTADCVPLLLYDPVKHSIAAVHSGWRGTLGNIIKFTLEAITKNGSHISDVYCIIGPHIRSCCYAVPEERAVAFAHRFGKKSVECKENGYFLDLTYTVHKQLMGFGMSTSHIIDEKKCTSCNVQQYYSFRKETKETFGEMLGFISISR